MAFSTFAITASPVYSSCLGSHPELYDYTGKYNSPRRTISLEISTPSGLKSCELISKDDAILLAKEASSFKEFYDRKYDWFMNKDGIYEQKRKFTDIFTIGKCDNLLVNIWHEGKQAWTPGEEISGGQFRLTILPFKPSVSKIINASPIGWPGTGKRDGFGQIIYSKVLYSKYCQKDGEYISTDRAFIAETPKAEKIYTREISFSEIKSQ